MSKIEPCPWNVMTNSRSNLGTRTKMCPTGGLHMGLSACNKLHTTPPGQVQFCISSRVLRRWWAFSDLNVIFRGFQRSIFVSFSNKIQRLTNSYKYANITLWLPVVVYILVGISSLRCIHNLKLFLEDIFIFQKNEIFCNENGTC